MNFPIYLYIGIIVWTAVPVRQFGSRFFYFFLFLVSPDLITLVARLIFHSDTNFFFDPLLFLALIALLDIKLLKKYRIVLSLFFLLICLISFPQTIFQVPGYLFSTLLESIIHLFILFILIKELTIDLLNKRFINLFLLILMIYEIMNLTRSLNYLSGFTNDFFYYKITSLFETLFAIFFIIFKADSPRLVFQLK